MTSPFIWICAITLSLMGLLLSAGAEAYNVHLLIGAMIAVFIALTASHDHKRAVSRQASQAEIASINARHVGITCAWAALVVVATYALILEWRSWPEAFTVLIVSSGLWLFLSGILQREAERAKPDEGALKMVLWLYIGQFAVMFGFMMHLVRAGNFPALGDVRGADWAASNIVFFGAFAVAAISLIALRANSRTARSPAVEYAERSSLTSELPGA